MATWVQGMLLEVFCGQSKSVEVLELNSDPGDKHSPV